MSMVADLLFGVMPDLPAGRTTRNQCLTDAVKAFRESQKNVCASNIEAVYQAIADGYGTSGALQKATGLAKSTCFNACAILLKEGRVGVHDSGRPHFYYVKER